MLIFVWSVHSGLKAAVRESQHENPENYRNYDAPEQGSNFVPYDSYEFAGVRGRKREELQNSRETLVKSLSKAEAGTKLCNLVIIPTSMADKYMHSFTPLRWDSMYTGIVVLDDGRKYLAYFDNGRYITAVEGSPDGIPFQLDNIASIDETEHWVSLDLIEKRHTALKAMGLLDKLSSGELKPGSY